MSQVIEPQQDRQVAPDHEGSSDMAPDHRAALVAGRRWVTHPDPVRDPIFVFVMAVGGGVVAYRFDGEGDPWRLSERLFLATFEPAAMQASPTGSGANEPGSSTETSQLAPAGPTPYEVPRKPCCRRIGDGWCTRTDAHTVPTECRTPPPARALPRSDFLPARRGGGAPR